MIDPSTIPNTIGVFPNVVSQNASGGGATDGTPYIKTVIDDLWGFSQALMDFAKPGATPVANGISEAAGGFVTGVSSGILSQRLQAVSRIAGHPGEIALWNGQDNSADFADDPSGGADWSDPASQDVRLLQLNGQGVLRANYPDLDRVTYCGDLINPGAISFYHATDAAGTSRDPAGAYLILPDYRGLFARGVDPGNIWDPSGSIRADPLGLVQADSLQEHRHQVGSWISPTFTQWYIASLNRQSGALPFSPLDIAGTAELIAWEDNMSQASTNPDETRPANFNGRWCIRF